MKVIKKSPAKRRCPPVNGALAQRSWKGLMGRQLLLPHAQKKPVTKNLSGEKCVLWLWRSIWQELLSFPDVLNELKDLLEKEQVKKMSRVIYKNQLTARRDDDLGRFV